MRWRLICIGAVLLTAACGDSGGAGPSEPDTVAGTVIETDTDSDAAKDSSVPDDSGPQGCDACPATTTSAFQNGRLETPVPATPTMHALARRAVSMAFAVPRHAIPTATPVGPVLIVRLPFMNVRMEPRTDARFKVSFTNGVSGACSRLEAS